MIGVVICTHAQLSTSLIEATEMIVGALDGATAVSVNPGDGPDAISDRLKEAIDQVDIGSGVIILCDMFGGTPSNISLSLLCEKVEIVTGVNLPMLVKLSTIRDQPLGEVAVAIREHGRKNILVAGALLRGEEQA